MHEAVSEGHGEEDGGVNLGVVVGIPVAVVALVVILGGLVLYHRHQMKSSGTGDSTDASPKEGDEAPAEQALAADSHPDDPEFGAVDEK